MLRIDHVQLAIPPGSEDLCRRFYVDQLGMNEIPKPPVLAARGGVWLSRGGVQVHLGVEAEFIPAKKAHPAFSVSDIETLGRDLSTKGNDVLWDDAIPDVKRFYVFDPVGNRIEFVQEKP